MVILTCNSNTQEVEAEHYKFKPIEDYRARSPALKNLTMMTMEMIVVMMVMMKIGNEYCHRFFLNVTLVIDLCSSDNFPTRTIEEHIKEKL